MRRAAVRAGLRGYARVGKNAVARLSAQMWTKLLSLVLVPLIARYEGSPGLGRYVLVTTVVGIVGALSDMGLATYLMREVARTPNSSEQRVLLGRLLPLRMGLSVGGYALVLLLAGVPIFPAETRHLLPLGALLLFPESVNTMLGAFINGRRRMEISSGLQMVTQFLAVAIALPVLLLGGGVRGVLAGTLGASVVGALLHCTVLWRWKLLPHWRASFAGWRADLIRAYPFAFTGIIAMVYARLDIVLLSAWHGEVVAGWYGAAHKLWEAFGLLPGSLLDALFPELARLASTQGGRARLHGFFRRAVLALAVGGVVLSSAGTALAGWLIPLLYGAGESYAPSVAIFRLLVWAIPAMFLYLLSGHILYALEQQRRVTGAMFVVGVTNITLNLLVIPRWSYLGAGGVALFSAWLLWGLLYVPARRAIADSAAQEEVA